MSTREPGFESVEVDLCEHCQLTLHYQRYRGRADLTDVEAAGMLFSDNCQEENALMVSCARCDVGHCWDDLCELLKETLTGREVEA